MVVAGFSQGGGLAIWLALSGAIEACGFVAAAPSLRWVEGLAPLIEANRARAARGYIVTGERDPRFESVKTLADSLRSHGIPCELESHPDLGHDFPPDFEQSLDQALKFMLQA